MKVGLVLSQPFGHILGPDARIRGLVEGLSRLGVEVNIIAPSIGNFSATRNGVFVHSLPSLFTNLKISNLTYKIARKILDDPFLFKNIVCRKSLLLKIANTLGESVYKIARRLDLDVVQAEQQLASFACIGVRKKLDVPVVADFHAVWAEEKVASDDIERGDDSYKVLFGLERDIACHADAVAVVSEEMRSYIADSYGASKAKIVVVPNAAFLRVENAKIVEHPSKVIHSGTLYPWENVELFVRSMPLVLKHYPSARFYLTRKGAKLSRIRKLAGKLGVSPKFTWFPSRRDFIDFLKSCDVGVISSTTNLTRKLATPTKLCDYLSVGLPIVANDVGSWTKMVRENEVGVVTGNSPEEFADGILKLLEDPKLIYECGQRGIKLVRDELNYYNVTERLLELYKTLA